MDDPIILKRPGMLRTYWFLCMLLSFVGTGIALAGGYLVITSDEDGLGPDAQIQEIFGLALIFFGLLLLALHLVALCLPRGSRAWTYHFVLIIFDLVVLILTFWPLAIVFAFLISAWQKPQTRSYFDPERIRRRYRDDWDADWDRPHRRR